LVQADNLGQGSSFFVSRNKILYRILGVTYMTT
jgi:hypothetical protein